MPQRRGGGGQRGGKSKIPKPGQGGKGAGNSGEEDGEGRDPDPLPIEGTGVEKILGKLASMDTTINDLTLEVREGIQATNFKVGELDDRMKTVETACDEFKERTHEMTDMTEGLKTRSSVHAIRLAEMEKKIEQLEREKRKKIIIIEGVPESADDPSPEIVNRLFRDLKVDFDTLVCDRIHRRAKETQGTGDGRGPEAANNNNTRRRGPKHRPIVVGFRELENKIQIFKHIKNLQDKEEWIGVYINDDLTECQQNQARDLRALAAYARSKGFVATARSTHIVVRGKKFVYSELFKLGPELTLEKAKTIECLGGKGIGFQSEHSPLSNLYPCNLIYKGKLFLSAEGALHYTRGPFQKKLCLLVTNASKI